LCALGLMAAAPSPSSAAPARYEEAVAARIAGDHPRAIALLREVVAAEPDNADAHLQLGLALLANSGLREAESAFRRTLALAPSYEDARIGLARVAQRRGNSAAALRALEPVGAANSEAAALRAQLGTAEPARGRWLLNLDGSYSALEGNTQPDWKEGTLQLRYQATQATALAGTVEASRRFGVNDVYAELRADHRLSDGVSAYLSIGGTPNADFRPEWQIGAGGSARLRSGPNPTAFTVDARQAHYRAGDIQTLTPGIEQYLGNGRAWVSARWINIFDETGSHQSGWLARGDIMATERLRLFAGLSDAPDVSEGVVIDTFALFGGISFDMDDRSTVRLSLAHEDRATGADRLQFGLGMGWRF
jgi:YaiO family outer membrane protein